MKTTAIIVAAGTGSRFNSDTPKQFLDLAGKPVVVHAIEQFQSSASIDYIVLVVPGDRLRTAAREYTGFNKLETITTGGSTRAESVMSGLSSAEDDTEIVAVHDGARPLISVDEIDRVVEKAKLMGAACLVAPVTDTIKTVRGEEISGTLDREKLRRALTPQAFRMDLLRKAFELEGADEAVVTDECYLVEKLGHPIAFVEGSSRNIKITTPDDMVLAEALMTQMNRD